MMDENRKKARAVAKSTTAASFRLERRKDTMSDQKESEDDCRHCRRRVESLWALVADEELPYDELPPEWRQRCNLHAVCDDCGKQGCEGVRTLYCPERYGCPACGKVHGVARGCVPTPVNWTAGLTPTASDGR